MTQAQAQSENERIRSYLIAQAAKLSIPELVEKVRTDGAQLKEAAATIPDSRFRERPGSDEWSAAEVWTHVLEMTEHGADAIEGILDNAALPTDARDVISGNTRDGLNSAADYWDAHIARRDALYAKVGTARGDEHPEIKMTHPMFGDFTWREWFLFMRIHDLDHVRQLQGIGEALKS